MNENPFAKRRRQKIWNTVFVVLVAAGIIALFSIRAYRLWVTRYDTSYSVETYESPDKKGVTCTNYRNETYVFSREGDNLIGRIVTETDHPMRTVTFEDGDAKAQLMEAMEDGDTAFALADVYVEKDKNGRVLMEKVGTIRKITVKEEEKQTAR